MENAINREMRVVEFLERYAPQAEGRDKAMSLDIQDKVDNVIDKLKVLDSLFEFYWFALDKADFTKDSLNGLRIIISDYVAELKEAVK